MDSLLPFLQSGKAMARTGLRMMPTFPSPPLKFRMAGFPRYGFKAGLSDKACPVNWFAIVLRALCCHRAFPALCQGRCADECWIGFGRFNSGDAAESPAHPEKIVGSYLLFRLFRGFAFSFLS
jgi:hypothetical protein